MTAKNLLLTCISSLFCINLSYAKWLQTDPKAEKYYATSPYAYCLNNPVKFIDPNGMEIAESSRKEWERNKGIIQRNLGRMQQRFDKFIKNSASDSRTADLGARISSINSTLVTMQQLETSSQVYALRNADGGLGGLSYDNNTGVITIGYSGTANFVHEITHGGQFETGDIAFSMNGNTLAQDVYDEVSAYKAQYAYDPASVVRLPSNVSIRTSADITAGWVQGIVYNGIRIYNPGTRVNTGLYSVNINSTKADLIRAYPGVSFPGISDKQPFKNFYPMYYKK